MEAKAPTVNEIMKEEKPKRVQKASYYVNIADDMIRASTIRPLFRKRVLGIPVNFKPKISELAFTLLTIIPKNQLAVMRKLNKRDISRKATELDQGKGKGLDITEMSQAQKALFAVLSDEIRSGNAAGVIELLERKSRS